MSFSIKKALEPLKAAGAASAKFFAYLYGNKCPMCGGDLGVDTRDNLVGQYCPKCGFWDQEIDYTRP